MHSADFITKKSNLSSKWFEIRDLRNEIAHDYEDNDEIAINILNDIYKLKIDLRGILDAIGRLK